MNIIGIIPARYSSTRLPGKPLKDICGKPMIQHVYENAKKSNLLNRIIVATDDERILNVVREFGGEAKLTSVNHNSGSERIAQVAEKIDCDIVVNIQGDEPLILPEIIDEITSALISEPSINMATGCYRIEEEEALHNPNVVKVVCDLNQDALFFSRSLIPYPRKQTFFEAFEHIGVYVYRKDFLMKYITFKETPLCETESLEQLKVLEMGYKIRVVKTKYRYDALSVDTEEDLNTVIGIMKKRQM